MVKKKIDWIPMLGLLGLVFKAIKARWLLPLVALMSLQGVCWAQLGHIEGYVSDMEGAPLASVTLNLVGTNKVALTDARGYYTMVDIQAGRYVLHVSYVGMRHVEQLITLSAGERLRLDTIRMQAEILPEIAIEHTRAHTDAFVSKMPLKSMDNPRVYTQIDPTMVRDQVWTRTEDALQNAPGVTMLRGATGRPEDGAAYFAIRGFPVQPTIWNGLPALTNAVLDPANVERIEIVKGPAGTLYGSPLIAYGGFINIITKRAHKQLSAEGEYTIGAFGLNRFSMDANLPMRHVKSALSGLQMRLNAAYHQEGSFQDIGFRRSLFVAPVISYVPNARLSVDIYTEWMLSEMTNPTLIYLNPRKPLQYATPDELGYDPKRAYINNHLSIKTPTTRFQACMNYALTPRWTSHTSLSRSRKQSDGYHSFLWDRAQSDAIFTRYINQSYSTTDATDLQQNLVGDLKTSFGSHQLLIGLDYFFMTIKSHQTDTVSVGRIPVRLAKSPPLTPDWVQDAFSRAHQEKDLLKINQAERDIVGVYVADMWSPWPFLSVMAGLRLDYFHSWAHGHLDKQIAFAPKAGLVLRPLRDKVSVFANWASGFGNILHKHAGDGSLIVFRPEQAYQWEGGIKTEWRASWRATLSYYAIHVRDVVRQAPNDRFNYIQDGTNKSQGIEFDMQGRLWRPLWVQLGYAYNHSEILTGDAAYVGRRPENAGAPHLANAWLSYTIPGGRLKGMGVAIGCNYSSENAILNRQTTGRFTLPPYWLWQGAVSYTGRAIEFTLKGDNLSNRAYFVGWEAIQPGLPRRFSARLSYRF